MSVYRTKIYPLIILLEVSFVELQSLDHWARTIFLNHNYLFQVETKLIKLEICMFRVCLVSIEVESWKCNGSIHKTCKISAHERACRRNFKWPSIYRETSSINMVPFKPLADHRGQSTQVNPIFRGGGSIWTPYNFFTITQTVFELGSQVLLTFLTNTCPSLTAKS